MAPAAFRLHTGQENRGLASELASELASFLASELVSVLASVLAAPALKTIRPLTLSRKQLEDPSWQRQRGRTPNDLQPRPTLCSEMMFRERHSRSPKEILTVLCYPEPSELWSQIQRNQTPVNGVHIFMHIPTFSTVQNVFRVRKGG